jgi:Arm DNA-binding domain
MNLTDRLLKSLKPDERPFEVMDSQVRAFGIRVMPSGVKTFILRRRYPGSTQPARRSLGTYGDLGLAQARDKAREWNALVKKGIDPAIEESRQRQAAIEAEKQRQASTFGAAFEAYLERKASKLKSGPDIEREIRREFKEWMDLPLSDITPSMVKAAIRGIIDREAATQAHFAFGIVRTFLNWCVDSVSGDTANCPLTT